MVGKLIGTVLGSILRKGERENIAMLYKAPTLPLLQNQVVMRRAVWGGRLTFALLMAVLVPASGTNSTSSPRHPAPAFTIKLPKLAWAMAATQEGPRLRSEHPLANAWMINSAIGVIGILFNSFELFVFYRERHMMINSVNVMIWSVDM